jgi:hypothetical protein
MDFAQNSTEPKGVTPEAAEPLQPLLVPTQNKPSGELQSTGREPVTRLQVWSHRLSLVVFVVFCIETGMMLAILPWFTIWDHNTFLSEYPSLRAAFQNNFVRGIATGLGLVDIWIGIWEAVHYHDPVSEVSPRPGLDPTLSNH